MDLGDRDLNEFVADAAMSVIEDVERTTRMQLVYEPWAGHHLSGVIRIASSQKPSGPITGGISKDRSYVAWHLIDTDPAGARWLISGAVQELVEIELWSSGDFDARPWPPCPLHHGRHPLMSRWYPTGALWECPAAGEAPEVSFPVGSLPEPDQGVGEPRR